jgi:hypothetical protein
MLYLAIANECTRSCAIRKSNSTSSSMRRKRQLAEFKRKVRTGRYDLRLPVVSWLQTILTKPGSNAAAPDSCKKVTLPGSIFNRPVNPFLLYQVVRWQRAKRRRVRLVVGNTNGLQHVSFLEACNNDE